MRVWDFRTTNTSSDFFWPSTSKIFKLPVQDSNAKKYYDQISVSPDGKFLAAIRGSTLQWICVKTGNVLETAHIAHYGIATYLLIDRM